MEKIFLQRIVTGPSHNTSGIKIDQVISIKGIAEVDRYQQLFLKSFFGCVGRKLKIEEAGIRLWKSLVGKVNMVGCRLDHESCLSPLEFFVVGRKSFLTPAKLNKSQLIIFPKIRYHIPKQDNPLRSHIKSTRISCMPFQKLKIDFRFTANPYL